MRNTTALLSSVSIVVLHYADENKSNSRRQDQRLQELGDERLFETSFISLYNTHPLQEANLRLNNPIPLISQTKCQTEQTEVVTARQLNPPPRNSVLRGGMSLISNLAKAPPFPDGFIEDKSVASTLSPSYVK